MSNIFTLRPGVSTPSLGIYGDFDELYAACSDYRTNKLPFTVLFDDVEIDIPTTEAYDLGGYATLMAAGESGRGSVLVVFADGTSLKGFNRVTGPIELQSQALGGDPPLPVGITSASIVVEDRARLTSAGYVPLFGVTGEGLLEIWLDNAAIDWVSGEVVKLGSVCSLRVRGSRGARVADGVVFSDGTGANRAQYSVIPIDAGTSLSMTQPTHTGYVTAEMPWMRELALFGAKTIATTSGTYHAALSGDCAALHSTEHSLWKVPSGNTPPTILGMVSIWNSQAGSAPSGHTLVIDVMRNGTAVANMHLELDPSDTATHDLFPEFGGIPLNQDDSIEVRIVHTGLTTTPHGLFVSLLGV